mmetsp:Transcript_47368/g.55331  ORF Transcript_47368/g.55331 Transcript_47368/m.55331 type:complete len:80 (-) Transcript_47368:505-744(-)
MPRRRSGHDRFDAQTDIEMLDQIYSGYSDTVCDSQDLVLTAATNAASWVNFWTGRRNIEVFNFVKDLAGEGFSKNYDQG